MSWCCGGGCPCSGGGCGCQCRQSCSEPSCTDYGNRCRVPLACGPGTWDQSYITKKDHLYFNTRRRQCAWAPRFDDKYGWNSKDAPVYATRFDAPSPVKPPWCPPGAKTRSYLYPRYYKRNCDGWYPDECRCRPTARIRNPCGTSTNECTCGIRRWSVPLCPCSLCGKSRKFPSPCCCGCAPSPATCPLKLQRCGCRDGCKQGPCCSCHDPSCYMAKDPCGFCLQKSSYGCSGIPPRNCCSCNGCCGCGCGGGGGCSCGPCCNNCCGPPRVCQSSCFGQVRNPTSSLIDPNNPRRSFIGFKDENNFATACTRGNDAGSYGCEPGQYTPSDSDTKGDCCF